MFYNSADISHRICITRAHLATSIKNTDCQVSPILEVTSNFKEVIIWQNMILELCKMSL